MGYGDVQMIDANGIRNDGRKAGDVRPISIELGVVPVADGSCRMKWGSNDVIAAIYGPMEAHPRKIQRQDRAVLDVRYNMAPFSTSDRIRPGFNRRSREISKVTAEALESVVMLELYPRSKIRVEIEIICAEAGTRCVGLTAASVALAHAGIPMTDLVVSVASGKINEVCIYFENQLFRGNRTTKINTEDFEAFKSPNFPVLAEVGVKIKFNTNCFKNSNKKFIAHKTLSNNIAILKLFFELNFSDVTFV